MKTYLYLGYVGAGIGAIMYIPQLTHMIKQQSGADISYVFLCFALLENSVWLTYGTYDIDYPIMASSACLFILTVLMIWCKYYYAVKKQLNDVKFVIDNL